LAERGTGAADHRSSRHYQLRHSFATAAILRGVDLQTIASLMGHSDLKMLNKVYQHIQRCDQHLRDGLKRIVA
jgi:site-specific recombinase XerD